MYKVSITRELGRNIRTRREALGYTQEVFAKIIGVKRQTLSAFERGERAPRLELLSAIASVLECEVYVLFVTGYERKPPSRPAWW